MKIIKNLQVAEIEDILKINVHFLSKLSSLELRILAIALEELQYGYEDHDSTDSYPPPN